jgi:type IV secretory pathway TrbD component
MTGAPRDAREATGVAWTEHTLHLSLVRPTLYLGVERQVIALEATLCLALVFGVGLSWATIALVALVVGGLHPVLVWLTSRDAQVSEVAVRSRAYADFYPPHADLAGAQVARRPTLPRVA